MLEQSTQLRKIQIVCCEQGWIVEKIAQQYRTELMAEYEVPDIYFLRDGFSEAVPTANIILSFIYLRAKYIKESLNITYVTHVDRYWKAWLVILMANKGYSFIVMSTDTESYLKKLLGARARVVTINPESIHFNKNNLAKKIRVGLFFRFYSDDRKNIGAVERLLEIANRHPNLLEIVTYGAGFTRLRDVYKNISISVNEAEFDAKIYQELILSCSYVIYFGRDEGAYSILDSAILGVPVLAIDQGFHKDLILPVGSRLFQNEGELLEFLSGVADASSEKKRSKSILEGVGELIDMPKTSSVSILRLIIVPFTRNKFLNKNGNISETFYVFFAYLAKKYLPDWVKLRIIKMKSTHGS